MIPIQLEGATRYRAPKGMEETCGALPVVRSGNSLISVWTFSDLERAAIARGENLVLTVLAAGQPPVMLQIRDIKGAPAPGFAHPSPDPAPRSSADRDVYSAPDAKR